MILLRKLLLLTALVYSGSCLANFGEMESRINHFVANGYYDSAEVYIHFELKKAPPIETIIELNHQLVSVYIYSSKYKDALDVAFKTIDRIEKK